MNLFKRPFTKTKPTPPSSDQPPSVTQPPKSVPEDARALPSPEEGGSLTGTEKPVREELIVPSRRRRQRMPMRSATTERTPMTQTRRGKTPRLAQEKP